VRPKAYADDGETAAEAHALVIVFDLFFPASQPNDPAADNELWRRAKATGSLLGCLFSRERDAEGKVIACWAAAFEFGGGRTRSRA